MGALERLKVRCSTTELGARKMGAPFYCDGRIPNPRWLFRQLGSGISEIYLQGLPSGFTDTTAN